MKKGKLISIIEGSAKNKVLASFLAVSLIGASGVMLSGANSSSSLAVNKTVLAGTLNNDGNKACVINGNDHLVLYTSSNTSNIAGYISVGEMLTINGYSNGYYNVTVQETGATGYISSSDMQKIVSGVGYDLNSLSGTAYIINVSTAVHLRENATMNSSSLAMLKNNTSVNLLGKQGAWYKVEVNGKTGYIYEEYVALSNTSSSTTGSTSSNTSNKTTNKITSTSNNKTTNNTTGTTKSTSSSSRNNTNNSNNRISSNSSAKYITVYGTVPFGEHLEIFQNPDYSSNVVLKTTGGGIPIKVLNENNGWCKVEVNNTIGYMSLHDLDIYITDYLSGLKPYVSPGAPWGNPGQATQYIKISSKTSIPLFMLPNTSSSILENISGSDISVTVYAHNNQWSSVKVGNVSGYIQTNILNSVKVQTANSSTGTTSSNSSSNSTKSTSSNSSNSKSIKQLRQMYLSKLDGVQQEINGLPKPETDVQLLSTANLEIKCWDRMLGNILNSLQGVLTQNQIFQLRTNEYKWLDNMESTVNQIRNAGGSSSAWLAASKEAALTKARCYYLVNTYM